MISCPRYYGLSLL